MKVSCDIIKDLLPLYAENLTSEDSNSMVREHLGECPRCTELLDEIKSEVVAKPNDKTAEGNPLKYVKEGLKKRKRAAVIFSSLCVFLLAFTVFSYVTVPQFVSFDDSNVNVTENGDGQIYVSFGQNVSSCRFDKFDSETGGARYEIEAWNSKMDNIIGSATPTMALQGIDPNKDSVLFCDYSDDNVGSVHLIYGVDSFKNGGMVVLPRLFLRFYLKLALISIPVIGLAWILLRKKEKLSSLLKYVFFLPISYVLSNLLLSTDLVSYAASRGFFMNIIGATTIYGIIITGLTLLAQHRKDIAN